MKLDFVKLSESLANYFGMPNDPAAASDLPEDSIKDMVESSTMGARSLSDYLTYRYYDEEAGLFIGEGGDVGFLMELSPIVGADEVLLKNLEIFFTSELPEQSFLQFILIASNDISSVTDLWKSKRTAVSPALKKLESEKEKFLHFLANNYRACLGRNVRDYKLYLSFNQITDGQKHSLKKLQIFMQNLKQKFETIDLVPRICKPTDLMNLAGEIVQPDLGSSANGMRTEERNKLKSKRYDPRRLLSDQSLSSGCRLKLLEDRIIHTDHDLTTKSYYVSEFPMEFSLNEMINLLGDSSRDNLSIPARFIISYTVASDINKPTQSAIIQKGNRVIDAAEQWYSRNNRDIKREAGEWRDINDRARNGERFLTEFFQVSITSHSDFIDEAEQSLFSLYNIGNWRLEVNRHLQLPALLASLPMQASAYMKYLKGFKLTRVALSGEIIAKLPIHAEWNGVPEPGMLLVGRRGQLFNWNPFYRISSGNYNVCIFGPSGSGKSVFLQELATSMMAQEAKVFILDIGQSFKNICQLLGGEIVSFGKDSRMVLSPFSGFRDDMQSEDKTVAISYAKSIVCSMCGAKGDNLKESIIEKAINEGLRLHGSLLDITKLADILLTIGTEDGSANLEAAQNLSYGLFSYCKEGIYGKFFSQKSEGPPTLSTLSTNPSDSREATFEEQITVFEFEEIKNDPLLLAVVLQIIGMQIFMQVLTGDRSKRFVLIVDEAWMILDYAAKFLAEFARTIRKYGGSLVVCVQNFSDLQGGEHQRAVLQNSTWTVLLKQDEKGINAFKESEGFKDMIPLIKSISISRDKYAECLLCATGVKVVGRLILDNYSKILYSTDADIFSALNNLRAQGKTTDEAVSIIAAERYGNVN